VHFILITIKMQWHVILWDLHFIIITIKIQYHVIVCEIHTSWKLPFKQNLKNTATVGWIFSQSFLKQKQLQTWDVREVFEELFGALESNFRAITTA